MGVTWTKEQQSVIDLQNRNILVSAAAGSGKTAVLVERIIKMLTREENPLDVDRLLIVTFTEAAAAEMKERIRGAVEKKLAERPDNEHLKQQETLIHNASITTIHSFCLSVIREHFHRIDLDPSFRIGEEGELKLLKQDVLEQVLESWYEEGTPEFLDFVESYARGRDDRKVEELIVKLYEYSRSYPDPEEWLAGCMDAYQVTCEEELLGTDYFQKAREQVRLAMESARRVQRQAIELCREPDGPYMYEDMLTDDLRKVERFKNASTYSEYWDAAANLTWMRLAANKDKQVSSKKAEQVKDLREEIKSIWKDIAEQYFSEDIEEVLKGCALAGPMMETLARLTRDFGAAFEEAKRERNLIDFDDMEQYALRILTYKENGKFIPSKVAEEYQEQFQEVMIDEYQDSNLIQEAILTSVSTVSKGRNNIFMVGDVKQSIYRFRLSRPELFMEKAETYRMYEGAGSDDGKQRIDLHKNFRSRSEVLESVNYIFRQIMTKALGGISYDDRAALYTGASYPEAEIHAYDTEVLLVDTALDEETAAQAKELSKGEGEETLTERQMEARAVARRIKELLGNQKVTDKESGKLRPARYGDIVILTRSIKGWSDVFQEVLEAEGIPVYAGTKEGYFETREIGVLLDYLRVLNNRKQDIPLAAVLASYFGGFTDEELAWIKASYPGKRFYESVALYAAEEIGDTDSAVNMKTAGAAANAKEAGGRDAGIKDKRLQAKLAACLNEMEYFRKKTPYTAIHELLWEILDRTGYGDYVAALPGGEQRRANVDMLVEKAMTFESTSYKGLFNFVRYIEQLQKYDVDYGEANLSDENSDTVRMMSIHKSKGLEFPIVIAAGMGKRFNQQDARGSVLVHAGLGVGLDAVDLKKRTKGATFLKRVIQKEEILETLGEELRVFYVALTRAKEKLILTGALKNPAEKLESCLLLKDREGGALSFGRLSSASGYLGWLLPAVAGSEGKAPIQTRIWTIGDIVYGEVKEEAEAAFTRQALLAWDTDKTYDPKMKEALEQQFSYVYPYADMEGCKLKFTVSELKKREYAKDLAGEELTEDGEMLYGEPEVVPLFPRFRQQEEELTGASRGSAYHRALELLDFARDYDGRTMKAAVEEMARSGRMSDEMAACIRMNDLLSFLNSNAGERMKAAAKKGLLYKEQPFVLGVDMQDIYPEAEGAETILVQGIIDVYFEEEDGLVVLDYKTDRVSCGDKLREKYHSQLAYYAKALERLTGKNVKEKIIYSFTLKEEIPV